MAEVIIDEFAMAMIEGRKPRLNSRIVSQLLKLINNQKG